MKHISKISIIIIVSAVVGLIYNYVNPKGINLIREEREIIWESDSLNYKDEAIHNSKNEIDSSAYMTNETIEKKKTSDIFLKPKAIKIDLAYKLFKEGKIFIDARPVEEFEENHIQGAINIPFYGSEKYDSVLSKISKDEVIITYCNGDDCDLSILLGDEIFAKGYKNVYVFFGGWKDWLKMNYPIEK